MKLQTLRPRLQVSSGTRIATLTSKPYVVERLRGSAGVKDRAAIKERDCGLCQECQRHGAARPGSKVDHRIPLWAGGDDSDSNKQLMCDRCHEAKSKVETGMRAKGESVPRPHGVHVPWDARSNSAIDAGKWRHGNRW
jgi:5-methylcytosine-specific restriction protein A